MREILEVLFLNILTLNSSDDIDDDDLKKDLTHVLIIVN